MSRLLVQALQVQEWTMHSNMHIQSTLLRAMEVEALP